MGGPVRRVEVHLNMRLAITTCNGQPPTICWAFWCMYCRALYESAADHCQLQKSHLAITTCIEKRLLVIPIVEGYLNFLLVSRGRGCIRVIVLYLSISIVLLTAWLHEPFRSASDHSKRSRHCVGIYTPKHYRQL